MINSLDILTAHLVRATKGHYFNRMTCCQILLLLPLAFHTYRIASFIDAL